MSSVVEYCSATIQAFAYVGMTLAFVLVWGVLGFLTGGIWLSILGKRWDELRSDEKDMIIVGSTFFPVTWFISLLFLVVKWIILPFTAAEKKDLRVMEKRINTRIDEKCDPVKRSEPRTKFVPGDLITGVRGNPDNYKHLNEGCVCRVESINDKGQMKLTLIGHDDFEEHKNFIGKEFKAPARNFVFYPRNDQKAKKTSSKKSGTRKR